MHDVLFTYAREGAETRVWTFTPDKLMSSEAEAIEKVTHMTYAEFGLAIIKGSVTARRALLWVFLKRTEPALRHQQIDFPAGAVEVEFEQHELKAIREQVETNTDLTDLERAEFLKQIDVQILDLMASAEDAAPKAPTSDDVSSD